MHAVKLTDSSAFFWSFVLLWRVVNIGNSKSEKLTDFIEAVESALGLEADKNYLPMQAGDVPGTLADTTLLETLTGYKPSTGIKQGVSQFIEWYREYYKTN